LLYYILNSQLRFDNECHNRMPGQQKKRNYQQHACKSLFLQNMRKFLLALFLTISFLTVFAQYKMRPVDQLIDSTQPGWRVLKQWIDSAKNNVEILPVDPSKAKESLYKTQMTTRSIMGAIVYCTGGILVDSGWIRILGSGSAKMQRTLPDWNKGKAFKEFGDPPAFILVADDAAGGYFAINYGNLGSDINRIYYLSPDELKWKPLKMTYEDFIWFCFMGNLKKFYAGIRWSTWEKDIQNLKADEVFNIYPPLWSKEGKNVETSLRKAVPAEQEFSYDIDLRRKMSQDKKGN